MKGKDRFTAAEASRIRGLLREVRRAEPGSVQKVLRDKLRRIGFYISDWEASTLGFTASDFEELVAAGSVSVVDDNQAEMPHSHVRSRAPRTGGGAASLGSGGVGKRAAVLGSLLGSAGHEVGRLAAPRPSTGNLPDDLCQVVLGVYRRLGGVQVGPSLEPGAWDLGCDGIAVELDEDLHFNRYRRMTLAEPVYGSLPLFPLEFYRRLCDEYEPECLRKGRGQARWTSSATERQFGRAGPRGVLEGDGAPRWKQRALYDFLKDLAPLALGQAVARVAVWDWIELDGSLVQVDSILRAGGDRTAGAFLGELVLVRSGHGAWSDTPFPHKTAPTSIGSGCD